MLKKTIKYVDFDGNERTEDFYFNLTKAECMEMELSTTGGMTKMINDVVNTQNTPKLVEIFKKIILNSYGEKSPDGKRFVKNDEIRQAFCETEAYSELFMELSTNADAASAFINGIIPNDMKKETPATIAAK